MKVVDITPALPEALRLFLEAKDPEAAIGPGTEILAREKTNHYAEINRFLDGQVSAASHLLEEIGSFQLELEENRDLSGGNEKKYLELKERVQNRDVELHRAKVKLTDLKIALCRFAVRLEEPGKDVSALRGLDEWMDAAAMAEMRLQRAWAEKGDDTRKEFLSLFATFRSILCSFDGPSQYLRQLDAGMASLEALHEKVRLEMDVQSAARSLEETRKELSTVKLDLTSLQSRMNRQQASSGELEVKKKPLWRRLSPFFLLTAVGAGAGYYFLRGGAEDGQREIESSITQQSCQDIANQIAKSPRYQGQVLNFRKFGRELYFKANALTCEKLHRLDSGQVAALADLLQADYETGNRETASFNGRRVLQVKDVGLRTLVVELLNPTASDLNFKVRVLELATRLKAVLQSDPAGDALVVELPSSTPAR